MNRKIKPIEELTIRDNFMFVKVFSDEEIAKPFLKALLKVDIEKVSVVGEAFQQSNPNKKCVRFDIMVKEDGNGIGRVFDLEYRANECRAKMPAFWHGRVQPMTP